MPVFDYRFTVPAPLHQITAFHFEPGILKTLTPPLVRMQVHRFEPLSEGSRADFTMWLGPIPVPWSARHSEVSDLGFTDTQLAGPMKSWRHTHRFRAIDDHTSEVHEHIEFEHDRGCRGLWSRLLFPRAALLALFAIRKHITRREVRRRMQLSSEHPAQTAIRPSEEGTTRRS